ncbi:MAG: CRTAC1 family protein [Acidobacteriia bacterium]|nr:CRTAC1 family protein [Terriglobia bacterium]
MDRSLSSRFLVARFLLLPIGMVCLFGSQLTRQSTAPAGPFTDVRASSGITYRQRNGAIGGKELIETFTSGCGLVDYDNDGLLDIYMVNGAATPSLRKEGPEYSNRLYRNLGNFKFVDVTQVAHAEGRGYGMGVAVGDYDNDGFPDLYITSFGQNQLLHNRGDGTFEDVTEKAGVGGGGWSTSAAFFDYDRDGYLDLFVARYVVYELGKHPRCGDQKRSLFSYCLPDLFQPMTDLLFHNNHDGTFTDVSHTAGIDRARGRGLGVTVGDYDGDGWQDIFVANDRGRNFLFHNKGDGTFEEVGLPAGIAYSMDGVARAGMGTDFGDYDQDGWLDILVNDFETEGTALFHNLKGQFFTDVGGEVGLRDASYPYVVFGGKFVDYDNDGFLDIFAVSGHTQDDITAYKPDITYPEPKLLFRNVGGRFRRVEDGPGGVLGRLKVSRGAAFGDLDNDGSVDVVVNDTNDFPEILRNMAGGKNKSLLIKLVGTNSNRDGIGTRLEVHYGNHVQILEAKSAASYFAANDLRVHVGLGTSPQVDVLVLHWPSGRAQTVRNLAAGYLHVISEDRGVISSTKLTVKPTDASNVP